MDSALRPRDIQARIRSGESPEDLAELGGNSLERVMVYAGPVLAEREHVAQRAQDSSVRRRSGEAARGTRTLGEAVGAHLRSRNAAPAAVAWDAWRREDGRWTLTAEFATTERTGTAAFTFDARGSFVTPEDDHARWLVGEAVTAAPTAETGGDGPAGARVRRLSAVPGDPGEEDNLGDDAIELVSDAPPPATKTAPAAFGAEETDSAGGARAGAPDDAQLELPTGEDLDFRAGEELGAGAGEGFRLADHETDQLPIQPHAPEETSEDPDAREGPQPEGETAQAPPRRPVSKKRGRASVPSWDEIMFGGNDQ